MIYNIKINFKILMLHESLYIMKKITYFTLFNIAVIKIYINFLIFISYMKGDLSLKLFTH